MYKYSLVLLAATAVLFNGCGDGGCCQNVDAPTAVIESGALATGSLSSVGSRDNNTGGTIVDYQWTVDGSEVDSRYILPAGTHEVCLTVTDNDDLTDRTCESVTITANAKPIATVNAPRNCVADANVNITGGGADSDGNIASYIWTPPGTITNLEGGSITCPSSGSLIEVCLTVTDNEGLASDKVCKPITATGPEYKKPIVELNATGNIANGFNIGCPTVRDQDTIDTDGVNNTYGTDNAIKEIYWQILYANGTQTDWNQTAFNAEQIPIWSVGTCGKWVYGNRNGSILTLIKVTPVDDEDENQTYVYELNETNGNFALQAE